jgi:capsular exopolysaccharide synthesis family protein
MNDTTDYQDYLPARRSYAPPQAPPPDPADDYADPAFGQAQAPRGVSFRLVSRALRRHWWLALPLWLAAAGGLAALAYTRIKPTYDAVSQIRVENFNVSIFSAKNPTAPIDFAQYMETQVSNVTSPPVVLAALTAHPELNALPLLRGSPDPEADLRKAVRAGIVPRTNLIQVEMSSNAPGEAEQVVNAVVEAFLKIASETYDTSTKAQIERLGETQKEKGAEVERRRKEVQSLRNQLKQAGMVDKGKNEAAVDAFRQVNDALTRTSLRLIEVKAKLDQLRNEKAMPRRNLDDKQTLELVYDAFFAHPRVGPVVEAKKKAEAKLGAVVRATRNPSDPARVRAVEQLRSVEDEYNELWRALEPSLRRQVALAPVDADAEKEIAKADAELAALKIQEQSLTEKLDKVRLENKTAEGEALELEFALRDLGRAEEVLDKIKSTHNELQYSLSSPIARVNLMYKARESNRPDANKRVMAVAAAPLVTGALVLGLLVLLELRGARVADPDELSSRVHLPVLGVVPPLPQVRAGAPGAGPPATAAALRSQRQLDEFVQSLDHLRVALCARRDPWGRDRHCVLITSACGSEGKTTLAAQLAERCVNAGLMTLVIDADLRNPTLSRMLDSPGAPGLINVLRGELAAEDVITVIGDAGGFHLVPAGTPRVDPSRLLASDRLGKLLAQARESFDMIIVDAPPVLPVPDALTIGRWTDGAVLAVRYDNSRFPLVERAYRRLAHVGVNVIGAVVNGVRSVESSYGGYSAYGYGAYGSAGDGHAHGDGHGDGDGDVSTPDD